MGIVFGNRGAGKVGHVFNVINQKGKISFIDGQSGKAANLHDGYINFSFLPTKSFYMKILLKDAIRIIEDRISLYNVDDLQCVILYDKIIDNEYYWVFFYNSLKFIETGDYSFALAGNSPFIVDKYEGKIYETGTSSPIEDYLKSFEQNELPQIMSKVE